MNSDNNSPEELVRASLSVSIDNFFYYDRKDDEDLPLETFENLIHSGTITAALLVEWCKELFQESVDLVGYERTHHAP